MSFRFKISSDGMFQPEGRLQDTRVARMIKHAELGTPVSISLAVSNARAPNVVFTQVRPPTVCLRPIESASRASGASLQATPELLGPPHTGRSHVRRDKDTGPASRLSTRIPAGPAAPFGPYPTHPPPCLRAGPGR